MSKKEPRLFPKTGRGGFILNIPRQIETESNPRTAHLVGFPRNILYTSIDPPTAAHGLPRVRDACYRPDPASYQEDERTREMLYLPRGESPYSVRVVHEKATGFWATRKYRGDTRVHVAHGADLRTVMMHATMAGVAPDEPADDQDGPALS